VTGSQLLAVYGWFLIGVTFVGVVVIAVVRLLVRLGVIEVVE